MSHIFKNPISSKLAKSHQNTRPIFFRSLNSDQGNAFKRSNDVERDETKTREKEGKRGDRR